jgi:hypothetical protein
MNIVKCNISFREKLRSKKTRILLIGGILGIIGGYVYYRTIGCSNGTCPLTSNPYMSMIWGGLMGYLIADMFVKPSKATPQPDSANKEE